MCWQAGADRRARTQEGRPAAVPVRAVGQQLVPAVQQVRSLGFGADRRVCPQEGQHDVEPLLVDKAYLLFNRCGARPCTGTRDAWLARSEGFRKEARSQEKNVRGVSLQYQWRMLSPRSQPCLPHLPPHPAPKEGIGTFLITPHPKVCDLPACPSTFPPPSSPRDPIDRMIMYFTHFFRSEAFEQGFSLAIQVGWAGLSAPWAGDSRSISKGSGGAAGGAVLFSISGLGTITMSL